MSCFVLVLCCVPFAQVPERVEVRLPEEGVFLSAAEARIVRARCDTEPWAAAIRDDLVAQAGALCAEPLDIPHKPGQWTHWYTCKEDGGALEPKSPAEHVCPICGKVYSGWPYDDVYVTHQHSKWLSGVETLGLAYSLDARGEFAARARAILLEYASFYEELPLHDVNNKQGTARARLGAQTLDESVYLCKIVRGYDAFRDAPCFSDEERARIADHLLRPMCAVIQPNDRAISNWQSWHNAAVACAGFLLRDAALVDWAINGRSGFLFQMKHSVLDSGMWYEESPSYHWYALRSHLYLLEAAARAGMDLYALPAVKRMFDAPLRQIYPDGTFPPMQDSDRYNIREDRVYYAIAYNRYRDPAYLPLIAPRDTEWSLFGGGDTPDAPEGLPVLASSNSRSEGLAILRDAGQGAALYLDYGAGRSGHVHPAKLNILLYADGNERFVDPGRLPYGNPLHKGWYLQTIAHNTVVADGKSQRRVPGKLLAYAATADFSLVRAQVEDSYKNVVFDRTLFYRGNTILDVFQCAGGEEDHVFDLPLHVRGTLDAPSGAEPCAPLGAGNGYEYVQNPMSVSSSVFVFRTSEERAIRACVQETGERYVAEGMGERPTEAIPLVLRRVRGKNACFVAVYELLGTAELNTPVPSCAFETGGGGVAVTLDGARIVLQDTTRVDLGAGEIEVMAEAGP